MTSVTRKRTESTSPVKNEHRNKHTKLDEDFDQDVDFDQDALLEATTQAEKESKSCSSPLSAPKTSSQSSATAHASSQSSTTPCVSSQDNLAFSSAPDGLFKPPPGVQNLRHDDPRVEQETMDPEWYAKLEEEINSSYFKDLKAFLGREAKAGKRIYPPAHLVHSWSRLTPLRNVKIVVVGQDPYHGPNQACGHSFSVPKGISVPGSLQNIYKELKNEYGADFQAPKHGCLDGWAKQGVLLLNACLTVTAGQAGSHHNQGWERFTQTILRTIAAEAAGAPKASVKNSTIATMFNKATKPSNTSDSPSSHGSRGVVFLAWGLPAQKTLAAAGITEVRRSHRMCAPLLTLHSTEI